jgi:uncharacterized protein
MAGVESCELTVRVTPRARANEIVGERGGALLVRVNAPPVDGRANVAVCRLIAKRVGVSAGSVTVMRGVSSRDKVLRVEGVGLDGVRRALGLG